MLTLRPPVQGCATDVSHLQVGGEHEVTWHPQALLEKALSVMGAVLGHDHHETWACRGYDSHIHIVGIIEGE